MAVIGDLTYRITGDTRQLDNSLKRTDKEVGTLTKTVRGFGATLVAAFAVDRVVGFVSNIIGATSDLNESINAVNVTFKDASDTINAFGETAAESVGLAQTEFNELATVIGAQLKGAELPIQDVANETINLTQRAADLASVFNTSVAEATTALGAALRGETEPARRFGINISQAAIEAEALASGLVESKNEITEQIKVQARLNLIFRQSADVAGDFANTSQSLANQSRIATSTLTNLAAELGQSLIPFAERALQLFNQFLPVVVDQFGKFGRAISNIISPLSDLDLRLEDFQEIILLLAGSTQVSISAFRVFSQVIRGTITNAVNLVNVLLSATRVVREFFNAVVDRDFSAVGETINNLNEEIREFATDAIGNFQNVGDTLVGEVTGFVGNVESLLSGTQNVINSFSQEASQTVGNIGTQLSTSVETGVNKSKDSLQEFADAASRVGDVLNSIGNQVSSIFSNIGDLITARSDQTIASIDAALQSDLDAAQQRGASEEELAEITARAERKKSEEQYKGKLANWRLQLGEAIATAPLAIINALNTGYGAGFPVGLVLGPLLAGLAATATGIQIASIAANKPQRPSFAVGTDEIPNDTTAEVHRGEMIVPRTFAESIRDGDLSLTGNPNSPRPRQSARNGQGNDMITLIMRSEDGLFERIYEASRGGQLIIDNAAIVETT